MNRQILSQGETLVYVDLKKLCLFWSIQSYCRGKRNRKLITINNKKKNNNNFKTLLYSGMCFWILGSALDSGKRFSFWEVCSSFLLTSGSPFSVLSATCQPSKPFSP